METTRDPQNLYGRQPEIPSFWTSHKDAYIKYMREATLSGIQEKQTDIKIRHEAKNYFHYEAPLSCKSALVFRCCRIDATQITKRIGMLCSAGVIGGAAIGVGLSALISLASGPAFPATFASIVGPCAAWTTTSGLISGIGGSIEWTVNDNRRRFSEYITAVLDNEPEYVAMREQSQNAKLGEVFKEFLNGYQGEFTADEIAALNGICFCALTGQFPLVPVFSPHDVQKAHPFEYSAIVKRLEDKEKEIWSARDASEIRDEDGKFLGYNQKWVNRVAVLEASVDPFGGPYFKKHQLIYDLSHMEKALPLLQRVHSRLMCETPTGVDVQTLDSIRVVIEFYKESSFFVDSQVRKRLKDDLVQLRMPENDAKLLADAYLS